MPCQVKPEPCDAETEKVSDFARHPASKMLTIDEVAAMARVDPQIVTEAVRDRKLKGAQVRGAWQVSVGEVRRWLSRR